MVFGGGLEGELKTQELKNSRNSVSEKLGDGSVTFGGR